MTFVNIEVSHVNAGLREIIKVDRGGHLGMTRIAYLWPRRLVSRVERGADHDEIRTESRLDHV